jgi:hypothetical protein
MKIVKFTERENTFYVWKSSRIELRYLALAVQCSYNLNYLAFSNYVKF